MYSIMLTCVTAIIGCDNPVSTPLPTFFAIGGDVYHAQDRIEAEQQLLRMSDEPRWFSGFPKLVSREEYIAWEKHQGKMNRPEPAPGESVDQIPTMPAYPQSIGALPLKDQGSSLKLAVKPDDMVATEALILTLTLASGNRAIEREIEHRRTNVLPFLFALTADGKPVSCESSGGKQNGGTNQFIELVPVNSLKTWTVRVTTASLSAVLPENAKMIEMVAVFSERQHEFYEAGMPLPLEEVWSVDALKKRPPQIVIRSNEVQLRKEGTSWTVER